MTEQEQAIVDRHSELAKKGWRDPEFIDYDKDGYFAVGVALQMCICDLCQKSLYERHPLSTAAQEE